MNITFDQFVKVCPSACAPDSETFSQIAGLISQSLEKAKTLLGATLFNSIDGIDFDVAEVSSDRMTILAQNVCRFVCADAYYEAIPHLDLVLTATGFGIVHNSNVSPASSDRVSRLRETMDFLRQDCYDALIDLCRNYSDWSESAQKPHFFNTLFWRASFLTFFGVKNPHRCDLYEWMPRVHNSETTLAKLISFAFFSKLLKAEETKVYDDGFKEAIRLCRELVAADILDTDPPLVKERLLAFLDANIEKFPCYANSQAYKANHFKHYENKADDSCYFFG